METNQTKEPIQVKKFSVILKSEGEKLTRSVHLDPEIVEKLDAMTEEESLHIEFEPLQRFATMKSRVKQAMKNLDKGVIVRKTRDGLVCWLEKGLKKEPKRERKKGKESEKIVAGANEPSST